MPLARGRVRLLGRPAGELRLRTSSPLFPNLPLWGASRIHMIRLGAPPISEARSRARVPGCLGARVPG
eukprot:9450124-Pyramimonas_sp.AAC.1